MSVENCTANGLDAQKCCHEEPTSLSSWLETAENLLPPANNAPEQAWFDYSEQVAELAGLPPQMVSALIKSKGPANFNGSLPLGNKNGAMLYGPMQLHSGLLDGGQWADSSHALHDSRGVLRKPADFAEPATGIVAGVQHLRQLVHDYGGDYSKALNHYQTGDSSNSNHALASWTSGHIGHTHGEQSPPRPASANEEKAWVPQTANPPAAHDHTTHDHPATTASVEQPAQDHSTHNPQPSGTNIEPESLHPSGHIGEHGHGSLINVGLHDSALQTVFDAPAQLSIDYIVETLNSIGGYNPGQSPAQKIKGAYLVANLAMKQAMMPPDLFMNSTEAGLTYGKAKLLAIDNKATGLRELIESSGGNTFNLSDTELINVWSSNEHNNLHGIVFGNKTVSFAAHMTSLNENDMYADDGMNPGLSGGYNDKGEYPQWGWFEELKRFPSLFSQLKAA